MKKIRVLHIIDSLEVGGAEQLLVNSLCFFKETNYPIDNYVVTLFKKGDLSKRVENNFNYLHLNITKNNFIAKIFQLRKYIKENEIQIVHSHLYLASIFARLIITSRCQLISTFHSGYNNRNSSEYSYKRTLLDKITYRKKHWSVFVSKSVYNDIIKGVKIRTNYFVLNNFTTDKFCFKYKFKEGDYLRIVSVGNLKDVKNYKLAIQGIEKSKLTGISYDIFGNGDLKEPLQKYIDKIDFNINLKGNQDISSELLNQYDLFLMTSKHEGMPIALIEAIKTGMPSLLNDLDELHETAEDSAIYFKKDSCEDLAKKLKYIIENKQILIELSEKTKKIASRYSIQNYTEKLYCIYKKMCII